MDKIINLNERKKKNMEEIFEDNSVDIMLEYIRIKIYFIAYNYVFEEDEVYFMDHMGNDDSTVDAIMGKLLINNFTEKTNNFKSKECDEGFLLEVDNMFNIEIINAIKALTKEWLESKK